MGERRKFDKAFKELPPYGFHKLYKTKIYEWFIIKYFVLGDENYVLCSGNRTEHILGRWQ